MALCPNLLHPDTRDEFNTVLERLGGVALDLRDVRSRNPYFSKLSPDQRNAYNEAHALWDAEKGSVEGINERLDLEAKLREVLETAPAPARDEGMAHEAAATALDGGEAYQVDPAVARFTIDAIAPHAQRVPDGIKVGALIRIEPREGFFKDIDARATFQSPDGSTFTLDVSRAHVLGTRAFFWPTSGGKGWIVFNELGATGGGLEHRVAGGLYHELVHALRHSALDGLAWQRLLSIAHGIDPLSLTVSEYFRRIGDAGDKRPGTLRETYVGLYHGRPDFLEHMSQEAVAHVMELTYHNQIPADQLAPIADLLEKHFGLGPQRGAVRPAISAAPVAGEGAEILAAIGPGPVPRREPSLEDTVRDLRDALGVIGPLTAGKGAATPSVRQQILAIANEGGALLQRMLGQDLRTFLAQHATELEPYGYPRSVDKLADGFRGFFRDFVARPEDAEARAPKFAAEFSDFLDAHLPHVLEGIDRLSVASQERQAGLMSAAGLSITAGGPPQPPPIPPAAGASGGAGGNGPSDPILDRIVPSQHNRRLPTWDEMYARVKDDLNPLRLVRNALAEGRQLPADQDPYILARLNRGNMGKAEAFLKTGTFRFADLSDVGPSLTEILEPVKDDLDGLRRYAVSRRALELNARNIKTGIPLKEAAQAVADGRARYSGVFERLQQYQRSVLDYLKDAGVIEPAAYQAMIEANEDYVPFHRLIEEQTGALGGRGLRVRQPIKGIKGSEREIIDPIETIVKNTFLYVDIAEHNRALTALADLAEQSPRGSEFLDKVKTTVHPTTVTEPEVARWLKDNGIEADASEFTIFRPNAFRPAPDEIVVYRNGKRVLYKVDPELGNAVNALDRERAGILVKILTSPARLLRAGATLSPEFIARNPVRDQFSALVFSSNGYVPVYDMLRGLGELFGKGEDFQNWLKAGGANAALVAVDRHYIHDNILRINTPSAAGRIKNVVKSPIEALRIASELMENATRLGEFIRARQAGKTPMEAAFDAREVTLDFARAGTQGRAINQWIPFWNAQLEGVDRAVRAFAARPLATTVKVAAAITLPSVLYWMANHKDKRWKEIPNWERDLFWLVMTDRWDRITEAQAVKVPDAYKRFVNGHWEQNNGIIWRIPKPFELGVLFGSVVERVLDAFVDAKPNAYKDLLSSTEGALLPNFVPQVMVPLIEQFANRSLFTQRPIVPKYLEDVQPRYQATPYTSETAQAIGALIAKAAPESSFASPLVIDDATGRAVSAPMMTKHEQHMLLRAARDWASSFEAPLFSQGMAADPLFARLLQAANDEVLATAKTMHQSAAEFARPDQRADVVSFLRNGADQPQRELTELALRYRAMLDGADKIEQATEAGAAYRAEYLPFVFDDPAGVREELANKAEAQRSGFLDLLEQGQRAGFRLKPTTNPEELVARRLLGTLDLEQRGRLLGDLEQIGLARRAGDQDVGAVRNLNWMTAKAPNGTTWLLAPEVQGLWGEAIDTRALMARAGHSLSMWRTWKNRWVTLRLKALSFGPLAVEHAATVVGLQQSVVDLGRGLGFARAARSLVGALNPQRSEQAWLKPEKRRTAAEQVVSRLMDEGGFEDRHPEHSDFVAAWRKLRSTLAGAAWMAVMPDALRPMAEAVQGALLERGLVSRTAAVYLAQAAEFLQQQPDAIDEDITRVANLRKLVREGEQSRKAMLASESFWRAALHGAGIGTFTSLGWSSTGTEPTGDKAGSTALGLAVAGAAMLLNGMHSYLVSGAAPVAWDFVFPRIGGLAEDGSPRRSMGAFYPMQSAGVVGETLWSRMLLQPFHELIAENDPAVWSGRTPSYRQGLAFAQGVFAYAQSNNTTLAPVAEVLRGKPDEASVLH